MGNLLLKGNLGKNLSENCNIYSNVRRNRNGTGSFFGTAISGYEGIPQNLVLNLIGWAMFTILFIFLRKKAWNYGRIAVMQKNEMKWTDMFYGGNDGEDIDSIENEGEVSSSDAVPHAHHHLHSVTIRDSGTVFTQPIRNNNKNATGDNRKSILAITSQKVAKINEIVDSGYFTWIKIVFTLKDEQYREKCGPDCVFYLSFQRHLILLASIITACSLLIILPINLQKSIELNKKLKPGQKRKPEFADTSIINLEDRHNFLWAHVILAIAFLFLSIAIMRHYSKEIQFTQEDSNEVSRSVMIIGLNRKNCQEELLRSHLLEIYPDADIKEISFAYDISKLQSVEFQRLTAASAKLYWEQIQETKQYRPQMRPYRCGVCGWCCKCKRTDAIDYYTEAEQKLTEKVEIERQIALTRPLGIAFVTFGSLETAERFVEDYACTSRLFLHTPKSHFGRELHSKHWIVKYAPLPEDINWENLTLDYKMWYVKFVLINLTLAVIVVIFTTPVYLFSLVSYPNNNNTEFSPFGGKTADKLPGLAGVIVDTLPTISIWIIGIILIALVSESDTIIGFWSKTAGNLSEMIKIFLFLTFMVMVLPSLGVTSIFAILNKDKTLSWSCIFYKENGALFINYVCTSTFVGTAAELIRLPELFVYAVKLMFARSTAEIGSIRKSVLWDFQIGSQYAWMMLHFALFTCFSVIYPLVTPFGLAYLIMKHWVDRYNIYFAYAPCKVEKAVHGTAVNFVIMCMFMLQINLLAYVHWHIGASTVVGKDSTNPEIRALQVFSLIGFSLTAALFLGQLCFNVCADFSPIRQYKAIEAIENLPVLGEKALERLKEEEITGAPRVDDMFESFAEDRLPKQNPPEIITTVDTSSDFPPKPNDQDAQDENLLRPTISEHSDISDRSYGRYIPSLLRMDVIKVGHHRRKAKKPEEVPIDNIDSDDNADVT